MFAFILRLLTLPWSVRLLFAASAGSLLFAFVMQYGFGFQPCILCLMERVPYGVAALLSLTAWISGSRRVASVCLALCAVAYLSGTGLAIFHTGVEQHWWVMTSGCAIHPLANGTLDAMREALLQTVMPPCDVVTWKIFGLSMANLNVPFSAGLAVFAALSAKRAPIIKIDKKT